MSESNGYVTETMERIQRDAMALRLKAEGLAASVQAASDRSWATLGRYRRAVAVLDRLLGRTAGQQERALSLSRRLRECGRDVADLRQRIEHLQWLLGDEQSPTLDGIRRDVQAAECVVQEWGEEPNAASGGDIDG